MAAAERVALVHDWLTGMRGGERVLEVLAEIFPRADLFTLFHLPGSVSPALEALPARFEGIFRKHMVVRDGALRDSAWYAVTDEEWPAVRQNLLDRLSRSR